jgi:hypothetical protein
VNLSEHDAPAVMELLQRRGVGIEAGLASIDDAERFVKIPGHDRVLRVPIEIEEQALDVAYQVADDIAGVLHRAGVRRPILLHGFDATVWPLVELARQRRWSTRVGASTSRMGRSPLTTLRYWRRPSRSSAGRRCDPNIVTRPAPHPARPVICQNTRCRTRQWTVA